jgi:hypothetical protein
LGSRFAPLCAAYYQNGLVFGHLGLGFHPQKRGLEGLAKRAPGQRILIAKKQRFMFFADCPGQPHKSINE